MRELASVDGPITAIAPQFERFERAYVEHACEEGALLVALRRRLGDDQRWYQRS